MCGRPKEEDTSSPGKARQSAFSTLHLTKEEEMALIMLLGTFGFEEMVSSISFMGEGVADVNAWVNAAMLKDFRSSHYVV